MADFLFDGTNKIIKEPVGANNTNFDVGRDIYSAWKRWVTSGNGQYDYAFTVEGGTPIGATGLFTGTTYLLVNNWKIMPADHNHQLTLNGNLYSDDGIVSVANPVGQSTVFISSSVNAQGVSTASVQQDTLNTMNILLEELHRIQGLDANNPMVITPTQRTAGSIELELSGDGETITTVTRQ
jgi:hypothetical protein